MTTAPTAPTASERFQHTVVAGWMRRLSENTSPRRNHWHTKLIYYRAAADVLASPPRAPLNWRSIVDAAGERGCRSTFYEVAGSHARHRMVDELISDGSSDSIQIALRYLRSDPVEQLIDETKVWSFWAYRQRLLPTLALLPADEAEAELGRGLAAWASRNPALAKAVEHTPPACAVEDLTVLHKGLVSGTQAAQRLTDRLTDC